MILTKAIEHDRFGTISGISCFSDYVGDAQLSLFTIQDMVNYCYTLFRRWLTITIYSLEDGRLLCHFEHWGQDAQGGTRHLEGDTLFKCDHVAAISDDDDDNIDDMMMAHGR